jgi:hypothetical protein
VVGGETLHTRFPRLFELSVDKNISIADKWRSGWGVGAREWSWRRSLFAWEEELSLKCCAILDNIPLQINVPDKWIWQLEPDSGYPVNGVYHLLTHGTVADTPVANQEVIWNKIAPLKVSLFTWRLLKNKLPSKDNLLHRGMNQLDSVLCVEDCGVAETSDHLFFDCKLATTF